MCLKFSYIRKKREEKPIHSVAKFFFLNVDFKFFGFICNRKMYVREQPTFSTTYKIAWII